MALANSGLTDENDIDAPSDELGGGELFILVTADGSVEVPVEGLEGFVLGEMGVVDAALDGTLASAGGLFSQKPIDHIESGEAFGLGSLQDPVELLGAERNPQSGKVFEDPVTKALHLSIHAQRSPIEGDIPR